MKHRLFLCCFLFITYSFSAAAQGIITTVAGGGSGGSGGLATQAALFGPNDVVVDDTGNIYIAEDYFLWKVDVNGIIHLLGGDGNPGVGGDGIHVSQARFGGATSIAFDKNGDLFIADAGNHAIRKVDRNTGIITKVVGDWTLGYAGDGGPANSAKLKYPHAIAFDAAGNLYIADDQYVIRKVDGQTGIISTVAGNGVKGTWNNGDIAINVGIGNLRGLCIDKIGDIYFADAFNRRIGKLSTTGILSVYCGTGTPGISGDGSLAINANTFASTRIKLDKDDNMFIADGYIRKIDRQTGIITQFAGILGAGFSGDGGPASQALFNGPISTCFDTMYNLYVADQSNYRIRKISGIVGVKNVMKTIDVKIYPNPTTGIFAVHSEEIIDQIEVRTLSGILISQAYPNANQTQVDITNHASGIYVVTVLGKSGAMGTKTVVHR